MLQTTLSRRTLLAAFAQPFRLPRKVRIAMLGFEGHPSLILGELPRLPDVEVVAFYGGNSRMPQLAKARQYSNYVELLEKERPDIAGICGPTSEHTPAILACAERRIHVASEKPLALSIPDLDRIKRAVAASGISLTMFLPMRFEGVFR